MLLVAGILVVVAAPSCGARLDTRLSGSTASAVSGGFYVEPAGDHHTLNILGWNGKLLRTIHPSAPRACRRSWMLPPLINSMAR